MRQTQTASGKRWTVSALQTPLTKGAATLAVVYNPLVSILFRLTRNTANCLLQLGDIRGLNDVITEASLAAFAHVFVQSITTHGDSLH